MAQKCEVVSRKLGRIVKVGKNWLRNMRMSARIGAGV